MKAANRPADNTKVIGLLVSVVAVFGFVVWRVMSALNGGGGSPPPEGPVALGGAPGGGNAVPIGGPAPVAENTGTQADIVIPAYPPGSTPNPFHKSDQDGNMTTTFKAKPVKGKGGKPTVFAMKSPTEQPVLVADPQPLFVKGVIVGDSPVAVISVGDKDYVVDRGTKFANGFRLKSVSATQVVVDDGHELHYLRVGGKPPEATPKAPPAKPIGTPPGGITPGSFPPGGAILPNGSL